MTNNNTVKVDLISVSTNKTEKSIKSLKSQIKDLRLQLESLDEGTSEYNATLEKLASLTHQQKELSETIVRANTDYGNTLSVMTKSANGVVASFSIINSLMGIMGNESSNVEEAMRTTLQYMQLIQGFSALDEAEKSFSELFSRLKKNIFARKEDTIETEQNTLAQQKNTNALNANANAITTQSNALSKSNGKVKILTNGVKGLWGALKSFVGSNPFTLLIAGIAASVTALKLFSNTQKKVLEETIEATGKTYDEISKLNKLYSDDSLQSQANAKEILNLLHDIETVKKESEEALKEGKEVNFLGERNFEALKKKMDEYRKYANESNKQLIEAKEQKKSQVEIDKLQQRYYEDKLNLLQLEQAYLQESIKLETNKLVAIEKGTEEYDKQAEVLQKQIEKTEQNIEAQKTLYNKQAEVEKQKKDTLLDNIDKEYQKQIDKLNEWLELELLRNEKWHNEGVKSNKKYYTDLLTIREEYYKKLEELDIENPKITEKDLINANNEILNARKQLAQYELDFAKLSENDKTLFISADEAKALKRNTERIAQDIQEIEDKRNMLSTLSTREAYNLIQKWNIKTEEQEYEHLDKMLAIEQEYYDEQRAIIERKYNEQQTIDEANQAKQLNELKYKVEKGLLDMDEAVEMRKKINSDFNDAQKQLYSDYLISIMEINEQQMNTEYEYSLARINIAENEIQRKIQLQELYYTSLSTVYGNISTLLGTVQSMYDENSKQYKNIARTQIIADGISTSVSAYKSGVSSGLPAPANLIYGGVLAGITTANTLLQLHNLEAERISNTSTTSAVSNVGSSTYETLAYTTLKDINGNIRDSKVYVVENEIQQVANRVHVYENESVF